MALHRLGFAAGLRRAREGDLKEAKAYMHLKAHHQAPVEDDDTWDGEVWTLDQVEDYRKSSPGRCMLLVRGFVVDATAYLAEHVSLQCFAEGLS